MFNWLVANVLIGHMTRSLILVDWSPIDHYGQQFLLRAAIPFAGRSLPIFEKSYRQGLCIAFKQRLCLTDRLLKAVLDAVVNDADTAVITRRDSEDAVVMSLDYYNSLMETVHLMRSPANAEHLNRSGNAEQFVAEQLKRSGRHIHRVSGHFLATEGSFFTLVAGLSCCQARFKTHWPRQHGSGIVQPAPD